jgi:inhibitor of cysteine peptidase
MKKQLTIIGIVAILVCVGLSGCNEDINIQDTGIIKYIDLEGGFYGIITDKQEQYDPINLPEEFKQDNIRIEFKAIYVKNQSSIHIWGKLIYILEIEQLVPQGNLTNQTTCKTHNLSKPPPNQDCLQYQYDGIQNLTLTHQNAGFNCCPEIATNITIINRTITIKEIELSGDCNCSCLFDLDYQILNLPPASYKITVEEPYILPEDQKLEFTINLTNSSTGSYCVERTNYPWG